ncbi:hypothetical protein JGI7_01514 [Candidatus Kryptonium thompsonii]|uniref:Uncharacterized protein n=2 Tax=Candidatus Kryptonium thompsonii TaxID=1633631 RepID=A0A0P1MG56_9BACT|nr:hypothetical protein JGI13_00263 [Candidatus Kryptonium thompsoni]CUS80425.1 hypothetical protein JGI8_00415 [Candidatus Kryptonium thompsoni]CUS83943.1 hypothetical protein JGI15_101918 [Candidatus Kryptonium thompsoni]CUS91114.1 hypothetical protein JGI7_01514 [Candidatus Kryptonium thompsoni]CUS92778.1 hypothetical protein JGI12_01636 [Candidatus Kryptonium thompsoni]
MSQNSLEFKIARELSNFYWNGFFNFSISKNSFELYIYEKFSEMVVKTDRKFIRDDNDFKFKFYKGINQRFKTAFVINSISFSDEKLSGFSKASTNEILTGAKFYPFAKFGFSFLGGYKIDNQMGQRDKGWIYQISSDTAELLISNYHLKTNLNHSEDFIAPRKNVVSALNLMLWRSFAPEVESRVEFLAKRIKRDFYFYADTNLQKIYNVNFNLEGRDERTVSGLLILGYPLSNSLIFNVNFALNGRNIDKRIRYKTTSLYDSEIEEFNLITGADLSYETRRLKLRLGINYSERNEVHTPQRHELITESVFFRIKQNEEQKNNKSLRRIINGDISFNVSEDLTLGGMFYISLFRYDTPSSLNDDDRDELLQIFRIFLKMRFSNEIQVELPLDLNSQHLVYIFSTRSVNNNWNRILRFAPSVIFESGHVRNKASFSVLANYIVYDFESVASSVKSYVFRQFYLNDSILFPIFDKLNFEGSFQLTFSESGRLKWKEFKEKPALFISIGEYNLRLNYALNNMTRFSVGYRFFDEKRYKFVGLDKVLDSRITATGPTSKVEFESGKFKLNFEGWVERLKLGGKVNSLPNLNLNLTINL